jgi:hypothetical protein
MKRLLSLLLVSLGLFGQSIFTSPVTGNEYGVGNVLFGWYCPDTYPGHPELTWFRTIINGGDYAQSGTGYYLSLTNGESLELECRFGAEYTYWPMNAATSAVVYPKPLWATLTAPSSVVCGEVAHLQWNCTNASGGSVTINPGGYNRAPLDWLDLYPCTTTTYTFTCRNSLGDSEGTITQTRLVTVIQSKPKLIVINEQCRAHSSGRRRPKRVSDARSATD